MKINKLLRTCLRVFFVGVFILSLGTPSPVRAGELTDLHVVKTLNGAGTFTQGEQGRTYTITVSNPGAEPTDGTLVTVTDTLPTGLTATAISGTGWSCTLGTLTCTRSDVLAGDGESYPVITLTVNVAVDAPTPVENTVTVSGGDDNDPEGNEDTVETDVIQKPDLIITGYELRNEANSAVITDVDENVAFWIRLKVKNQGSVATGLFYPGVFLDDKPDYGIDNEVFGHVKSFQDYRIAPEGSEGFPQGGCLYYDPSGTINPLDEEVQPERGNYTRSGFNPSLPAGAETTVDVYIGYPEAEFPDQAYDDANIRTGLSSGTYNIYLYVDPNCSGGDRESIEDNNSYGPITISIEDNYPPTLLVNSVLPTSRTPFVGSPVTIFNTVINAGVYPATGVTLSMVNQPAGTFSYRQSNCANNSLIGGVNPSITIPAGGVACYVLTFTPSAPFAATNVHIRAQGSNAAGTNLLLGINTWLLRATASAGPDIIALTTTTDFHQIACSGTNAFAVASSNVGTATTGNITVTANTGSTVLPLSISISETNPSTGVIIGDHILENIGAGENRTVVVFVTFHGCVSFDPANKRIFIEFRDASNNVVGSTSTAVSTNR